MTFYAMLLVNPLNFKEENKYDLIPVEGTKFTKKGLDAFIFKNKNNYYVLTNRKNGHKIVSAKKKKDIESNLEKLINKTGEEKFYKIINQ